MVHIYHSTLLNHKYSINDVGHTRNSQEQYDKLYKAYITVHYLLSYLSKNNTVSQLYQAITSIIAYIT